jgi:uncharacterized oxidoreductase
VQTDLLNSNDEPRAMPLAQFIEETMHILGSDAEEIVVEKGKSLRDSTGPESAPFVKLFNDMMTQVE